MVSYKIIAYIFTLAIIVACLKGCSGKPDNPTSGSKMSGELGGQEARKPFLDQKKEVPAGREWIREVTSRFGGTFRFRVTAQGAYAVTVITDKGYRALQAKQKVNKDDILLTFDSQEPTLERSLTVGAGSTWFILENHTDKTVEFRLQCFEP